ncbi:MAG: serine hydrolase [Pseudomonadota bacterium]
MAGLAHVVDEVIGAIKPVGGVVGLYRAGDTEFLKGFGYADFENRQPFTPDTRFRCCSVTKQFTVTLILLAQAEGRLSLDDTPNRYLPWLPAAARATTLRNLATNQSGIPDYWCIAMLTGARAESRFRAKDGRRLVEQTNWLDFEPGSRFAYSNTNFLILGWIAEAVFGAPLAELMETKILGPLGMTRSALSPRTSEPLEHGAVGYEPGPDGKPMRAPVDIEWFGDAGLVSCVGDLARWARLFDGHGPAPLVACAKKLGVAGTYRDGRPAPYRFGVSRLTLEDHTTLVHFGALRGWRMALMHIESAALTVIAAFNSMVNPAQVVRPLATYWLTGKRLDVSPESALDAPVVPYRSRELGLIVETQRSEDRLYIDAGGRADTLARTADGWATPDGRVTADIRSDGGTVRFVAENVDLNLSPLTHGAGVTPGHYTCAALQSELVISSDGSAATFLGPLGCAESLTLETVGEHHALLRCERALDHPAPGAFTLYTQPHQRSLQIGCWAAGHTVWTLR